MNDPVLTIREVSKTFNINDERGFLKLFKNFNGSKTSDRIIALDNISFEVSKGEMVGIIGPNGSGKTTLLRTIAGIYKPDSGMVQIKGRLAPLLQIGMGFRPELNASENIIISGMLNGLPKQYMKNKINEIMKFAELEQFSNMKLTHYSSGMRARLAFTTAIQMDPDILLVDEILSVGDVKFREKSFDAFLQFKKEGKTIVYITHNLGILPKLCDKVILLHHGKIITMGEPQKVIEKYRELSKHQT